MMKSERLNFFLYQPMKVRCTVFLIVFILILLLGYYIFVVPVNDEHHQVQFNNLVLADDVLVLENKVLIYPAYEHLIIQHEALLAQIDINRPFSTNMATMLHHQLLVNKMKLIDLSSKQSANQIQFYIQTQGHFQDLIQFINQLVVQDAPVDVTHISIINDNNILSFYLTLGQKLEINTL